jgi:hypothetical protein
MSEHDGKGRMTIKFVSTEPAHGSWWPKEQPPSVQLNNAWINNAQIQK